jgi:hypothetical protein
MVGPSPSIGGAKDVIPDLLIKALARCLRTSF